MAEKLAMEGGVPVRKTPLPPPYPGALVMGEEEKRALCEVITNQSPFRYYGVNAPGKVREFENALSQYLVTKHALGVTSCTAALKVALVALGVGPGDEVIIPAYTFIACVSAVVAARAVPVFAEIDDSLNIDPADAASKITPRTRVLMPVHFQGVSCDMKALLATADKHGIAVLEDCAQAMGCEYGSRKVGTLGNAGAFSLQINKLITTGEGGAVVTDDREVFLRAVRYHDHGNLREFEGGAPFLGENYRMSELTGAVACAQFSKLPGILSKMKRAQQEILAGIREIDGLTFRRIPLNAGDIGACVAFLAPSEKTAKRFVRALNAENITSTQVYGGAVYDVWPQALDMRTATPDGCPFTCPRYLGKIEYRRGMCPVTEEIASRLVHIAVGPTFGRRETADIVTGVRKVAATIV